MGLTSITITNPGLDPITMTILPSNTAVVLKNAPTTGENITIAPGQNFALAVNINALGIAAGMQPGDSPFGPNPKGNVRLIFAGPANPVLITTSQAASSYVFNGSSAGAELDVPIIFDVVAPPCTNATKKLMGMKAGAVANAGSTLQFYWQMNSCDLGFNFVDLTWDFGDGTIFTKSLQAHQGVLFDGVLNTDLGFRTHVYQAAGTFTVTVSLKIYDGSVDGPTVTTISTQAVILDPNTAFPGISPPPSITPQLPLVQVTPPEWKPRPLSCPTDPYPLIWSLQFLQAVL